MRSSNCRVSTCLLPLGGGCSEPAAADELRSCWALTWKFQWSFIWYVLVLVRISNAETKWNYIGGPTRLV